MSIAEGPKLGRLSPRKTQSEVVFGAQLAIFALFALGIIDRLRHAYNL